MALYLLFFDVLVFCGAFLQDKKYPKFAGIYLHSVYTLPCTLTKLWVSLLPQRKAKTHLVRYTVPKEYYGLTPRCQAKFAKLHRDVLPCLWQFPMYFADFYLQLVQTSSSLSSNFSCFDQPTDNNCDSHGVHGPCPPGIYTWALLPSKPQVSLSVYHKLHSSLGPEEALCRN